MLFVVGFIKLYFIPKLKFNQPIKHLEYTPSNPHLSKLVISGWVDKEIDICFNYNPLIFRFNFLYVCRNPINQWAIYFTVIWIIEIIFFMFYRSFILDCNWEIHTIFSKNWKVFTDKINKFSWMVYSQHYFYFNNYKIIRI